jgi:hypothetical protein
MIKQNAASFREAAFLFGIPSVLSQRGDADFFLSQRGDADFFQP